MRQYVDTMGILFMVYGGIQMLAIVFLLLFVLIGGFLGVLGISQGVTEMVVMGAVYAGIGLFAGVISVLFGTAFLVVGNGVRRRAPWARIASMIAGGMVLMNAPLGTLLGVFNFVVMLDPEVAKEFSREIP